MTQLNIDRIKLRVNGVPAEIAQSALDGLDVEILRRLQKHGFDSTALSGLSSSLRLPAISSPIPLNAETLRARLVDGLMTLLLPADNSSGEKV